jgi:hypothetical protein
MVGGVDTERDRGATTFYCAENSVRLKNIERQGLPDDGDVTRSSHSAHSHPFLPAVIYKE